jgi:hypothetical protein
MSNSVGSLLDHFERILRWIYPGLLVLTLWPGKIGSIVGNMDYRGDSFWPFFLVAIGIGAGIYLVQYSVVFQILNIKAQKIGWDVAKYTYDYDPNGLRPMPSTPFYYRMAQLFDPQVTEIERKIKRDEESGNKKSSMMDYQWGMYHAISITGFLLFSYAISDLVLTCCSDNDFPECYWWKFSLIIILSVIVFFFSLYLFARNCRVRR